MHFKTSPLQKRLVTHKLIFAADIAATLRANSFLLSIAAHAANQFVEHCIPHCISQNDMRLFQSGDFPSKT